MKSFFVNFAVLLSGLFLSSICLAGEFELEYSGTIRGLYGVMDTKKKDSHNNLPNRLVSKNDFKASLEYAFDDEYSLGLINNSGFIRRQHDDIYLKEDARFYNYGYADTPFGRIIVGQDYNVANKFHKGGDSGEVLNISDEDLNYFLFNPNWQNGKDFTAFYTPKSTAIMNDGRAFKFSYITPEFYNTLVGFTYTPDNKDRRGMVSRYTNYQKKEDGYVVALHNELELDFADIYTSIGYGIFNRTDKELSLGITLVRGGWSLAGGYKNAYIDGNKNPITVTPSKKGQIAYFDNYRESEAWDISLSYEIGPLKSSIMYLHTKAKNTSNKDDIILITNSYDFNKWIEIYLIGGYTNARGYNKEDINSNKGYVGIFGLGLSF